MGRTGLIAGNWKKEIIEKKRLTLLNDEWLKCDNSGCQYDDDAMTQQLGRLVGLDPIGEATKKEINDSTPTGLEPTIFARQLSLEEPESNALAITLRCRSYETFWTFTICLLKLRRRSLGGGCTPVLMAIFALCSSTVGAWCGGKP